MKREDEKEALIGTIPIRRFTHDPLRPTDSHWDRYCDWRASKCPDPSSRSPVEEIVQATLEFIGEMAEFCDLFAQAGQNAMTDESFKARLIDEAGDIVFTGAWAMDAWGFPILRMIGQKRIGCFILGPEQLTEDLQARTLFLEALEKGEESMEFRGAALSLEFRILSFLISGFADAGLTADALKKAIFQGRTDQSRQVQAERIMGGISSMERALVILGSTLKDAVSRNIAKLDARYPNGWTPGGGIRTGEGK